MIIRNSVLHSRRAGIITAFGLACGVAVHTLYCGLGIATLISQSATLFMALKYIGAAYLIYIGFKALRSKGYADMKVVSETDVQQSTYSAYRAWRDGFFTNLLNPKATMFFLALFTQIIKPDTPAIMVALYGLSASAVTIIWFSSVASVLNQRHIRRAFLKFAGWIDKICGVFMIGLGIRLAISKIG
ncbi:MAG: LysE family transporter [Alphaproteobacteria bacterium]|nr:LysE family transporter [Alphaproteobacteria bacterium]MCD8570353.1 LysE family transporter [Alphaproteobacteria bacterium]